MSLFFLSVGLQAQELQQLNSRSVSDTNKYKSKLEKATQPLGICKGFPFCQIKVHVEQEKSILTEGQIWSNV